MNDLTQTLQQPHSSASSVLAGELAKMLGLVAPVTMSADQQTLWIASAVDALQGIRPNEVAEVSAEVRRTVTRPSQIVPEVAKLVAQRRARRSSIREASPPVTKALPAKRHIMDRDRSKFTAADWAELNEHLEKMGSSVRYLSDGTRTGAA